MNQGAGGTNKYAMIHPALVDHQVGFQTDQNHTMAIIENNQSSNVEPTTDGEGRLKVINYEYNSSVSSFISNFTAKHIFENLNNNCFL